MLDARALKARYSSKWRLAARRELLSYNILNILLARYGCYVLFTGVGSGYTGYVPDNYDSPLNAFDFAVFCSKGKGDELVAFVDVTGYRDYSDGRGDTKPCILYRKVEKAKRLGIPLERVWFLHFVDTRVSMRLINAHLVEEMLAQGLAEKRKLYRDENWYICIEQRRWLEPRNFMKWLAMMKEVNNSGQL
ncbi:Viral/Archaeal nuclease [Pyrodictium delaneyi]|uniref:Viral/Archaeal nuclease n=1 Tax=Pyrodictium delaneyi TaxID=1273541 RepID=A0A0P0N5K4_9CREN|nr:nuclease [Pyrodictium delaneyi]ALL01936.1 Viral/Archaeal nuclease [Pyrodictium delaneyi]